jgi:hypothetical protein
VAEVSILKCSVPPHPGCFVLQPNHARVIYFDSLGLQTQGFSRQLRKTSCDLNRSKFRLTIHVASLTHPQPRNFLPTWSPQTTFLSIRSHFQHNRNTIRLTRSIHIPIDNPPRPLRPNRFRPKLAQQRLSREERDIRAVQSEAYSLRSGRCCCVRVRR